MKAEERPVIWNVYSDRKRGRSIREFPRLHGEIILKKGKPVADSELRDTENVPLTEDIHEYFQREVIPFAPDAWIDESKTKIGYEIPFTRYFYKYVPPRPSDEVLSEIMTLQKDLEQTLKGLF